MQNLAPTPTESAHSQAEGHVSGIPYVGLRSYEREERCIFFGRDRDAKFLCDKVFSARLTLFYGQSGLGKSSILKTLVIPLLEEQHAHSIYFDAWAGEDPAALLKATLIETATKLNIPGAGAGGPNLKDLAALLSSAQDKTIILVFDQFEEFLTAHGQHLDPLRKELGALVRATGLDVRVLISLRQEFLAALEPFRQEILNLFQSTYLLEPLDDHGTREAIERPAKAFGVTYEPQLVDLLLKDLRVQESLDTPAAAGAVVDLPMMQLVCTQLWEAAQKREASKLTLTLYEELGGAKKILDAYVRGVMPERRTDQYITAKLMRHLAPSSGLKKPYSADELAENEELDTHRVRAELERLAACRILRTREFRGNELFELQHDAFIRIIEPWRDKTFHHLKVERRWRWIAGVEAVILVLIAMIWMRDRIELKNNTEGAFNKLRAALYNHELVNPEATFDAATHYLLFRRNGPKRFDKLRDLLQHNEDMRPNGYGLDRSLEACSSTSEVDNNLPASTSSDDLPLSLHYSASRKLNKCYFNQIWKSLAESFATEWGIPVPSRLRLVDDQTYPMRRFCLKTRSGDTLLRLQVEHYEDWALIKADQLPAPVENFRSRFINEWKPITGRENMWVVKCWSLPVWKLSGQLAEDGSGYPAYVLATELLRNPDLLLPEGVFKLLLRNVEKTHPNTLREAVAARGDKLRSDFLELIKLGRPHNLPIILDALADHPTGDSKEVAAAVDVDLKATTIRPPSQLHGPWKNTPAKKN